MTAVTLEELQKNPRVYLERAHAGERLVIFEADHPLAEIKPVTPETPLPRPFGLCRGEFTVPDDFDAPLPDDLLALFEGR